MKLIQSNIGQRAERYSLKVNPTFETAIRTPLTSVRPPKLKAWEEWNSPAVQALRLYQQRIENAEELEARRRDLDNLMRRVAAEYGAPWPQSGPPIHTPTEDEDEDGEPPPSPTSPAGEGPPTPPSGREEATRRREDGLRGGGGWGGVGRLYGGAAESDYNLSQASSSGRPPPPPPEEELRSGPDLLRRPPTWLLRLPPPAAHRRRTIHRRPSWAAGPSASARSGLRAATTVRAVPRAPNG
jgi:hypothetical protein